MTDKPCAMCGRDMSFIAGTEDLCLACFDGLQKEEPVKLAMEYGRAMAVVRAMAAEHMKLREKNETMEGILEALGVIENPQEIREDNTVRDPKDVAYLNHCGRAVNQFIPDNHQFILMVVPENDGTGEQRLRYISTLERETAVNVLKEWLLTQSDEDWLKHID